MMVASSISAGGLTAVAAELSRKKNGAKEIPNPHSNLNERSNANENNNEDVHANGR